MKNNINLKVKGFVTITKDGTKKPLVSNSNNITVDATQVIMRCLPNVPIPVSVDTMILKGDFGETSIPITDSIYDSSDGSITFIGTALEQTFNGTLNEIELGSALLNLYMANKNGLSIVKDDSTRLQITWKITITNC